MIYVNGDSHSAGAEIVKDYCFAQDDPRFLSLGRQPHPEAVPETFGYKLAQALNIPLELQAESASSNHRILRTTQDFIETVQNKSNLFVLIGWTTWEREEWQDPDYREVWYQVTASGTDSVASYMREEYKEWVLRQTPEERKRKELQWTDKIAKFSAELDLQGIKHLFFHVDEYTQYLKENGFSTVNNGYHYGADGHTAWFKHLLPKVMKAYTPKTGLTQPSKPSIITSKPKQQFKGFNQ